VGALDDMVEMVKVKSREIVESGEEHRVMAFVDSPQGMGIVANGDATKDQFMDHFRRTLQSVKATGYVLVMEAWATTSERPMTEGIAVSEMPLDDRTEILQLMVVENGTSLRFLIAKIDDTPQGRKLGEFEEKDWTVSSGRMVLKEW
jgi:hypothetical protein